MRLALLVLALAPIVLAAAAPTVTLRGKLAIHEGKPAALQTTGHKRIQLDGDETTRKVLADSRLNGFDVEIKGHFAAAGRFAIDPMREHGMMVRKDGRLKLVTYFCDACSIHYATPGPCACCQKETTVDLVDPDVKDK
jgi:hypothetical protein